MTIKKENLFEENFKSEIDTNTDVNINGMRLSEFLSIKLRFREDEVKFIVDRLSLVGITTIDDLKTMDSDSWSSLKQYMPSKINAIKNEVYKLTSNMMSKVEKKGPKGDMRTRGEQLADWHKLLRFLYFDSDSHELLGELGYLSMEAVDLGLDEQKSSNKFNSESMLNEIKDTFEKFTIRELPDLTLSHGMLLYGPPGTGKTSLINIMVKKVGLKLVVPVLASVELNRGLVGQTEELLRDIIQRANFYPYLLVCVAIDEIDALVPKRDGGGSGQNTRIDALTQLLTLIGGAQDVKNVYMIGIIYL